MKKRKAVINRKQCVACGCCMKVCPRNAITIPKGIHADVNRQLCVGCPASVISFEVLEVADS